MSPNTPRKSVRSAYDQSKYWPELLLYALTTTSRSGSTTGGGRQKMARAIEYMAVLAPTPRPSVRMTMALKPGLLVRVRAAYLRSWNRALICSPEKRHESWVVGNDVCSLPTTHNAS